MLDHHFEHLYKILDPLRLTHTHSPAYPLSLLNSIPSLTKHPQSSPYHPPYLLIKPPQPLKPRRHSSYSMAHPPPISPPLNPSLHHTVWPTVRGSAHQEQIHRQNLHPTFQSSAKTWSYKEIRSSVWKLQRLNHLNSLSLSLKSTSSSDCILS